MVWEFGDQRLGEPGRISARVMAQLHGMIEPATLCTDCSGRDTWIACPKFVGTDVLTHLT